MFLQLTKLQILILSFDIDMIIGENEICLKEIGSTNLYAKELLSKFKPFEGTAIFAEHQLSGKGQNGNIWLGASGQNLYLSVILYPHFLAIKNHYLLNKAICVSAWEAIAAFYPEAKIKWPNDIYAKGKKITGILIENSLQGSIWQSAVVGIGINLNQQDFPENIPAISLSQLCNKEIDKTAFRKLLYQKLNKNYLQLRASKKELIDNTYTKNLLGYHEKSNFLINGKAQEAVVLGVQNTGELCLEFDSKLHYFRHGDIKQIIEQ